MDKTLQAVGMAGNHQIRIEAIPPFRKKGASIPVLIKVAHDTGLVRKL
jgi:hypothetical protein